MLYSRVREAFVSWTTTDYHAARSWVAAQDPAQPWIGPAAALYAHQLAHEDPLAALAWADRIHDDELRRATLGRCARSWLLKDKAAATEWIENSSLPDDFKRRIYTIPSGMKPRERR